MFMPRRLAIRKMASHWRNRFVQVSCDLKGTLAELPGTDILRLATAPGITTAGLSVALTTPHAGMPMFRFTAEQREDVIAYILSLR